MQNFMELMKSHEVEATDYALKMKYFNKNQSFLLRTSKLSSHKSSLTFARKTPHHESGQLDIDKLFTQNRLLKGHSPLKGNYSEIHHKRSLKNL